jgi:hypothetical protein
MTKNTASELVSKVKMACFVAEKKSFAKPK